MCGPSNKNSTDPGQLCIIPRGVSSIIYKQSASRVYLLVCVNQGNIDPVDLDGLVQRQWEEILVPHS